MTPVRYIIEVYPLGWVICGPRSSVPMEALTDCAKLAPKKSVIDPGIVYHFRATGLSDTVVALGLPSKLDKWRKELAQGIAHLPPEERWWKGFDVGRSSAAIFAVLTTTIHRHEAAEFSQGAAPRDAGDFGRCKRLLDLFPEWRPRLHQVAEAYPATAWPRLVAIWHQLETAEPEQINELLCGKEQA